MQLTTSTTWNNREGPTCEVREMQVRQCHCCGKGCGQDWTFCPHTGEPVSGGQPAAPPDKGAESASAILVNLRKKVSSMGFVVTTILKFKIASLHMGYTLKIDWAHQSVNRPRCFL